MRWIKHITATRRDPSIAALLAQLGLEGYGQYWAVLEIVADHMDWSNDCSVQYPVEFWRENLKVSRKKLGNFVKICAELDLFYGNFYEKQTEILEISAPKLLKYRDEYSKKSRHSPDKIKTDTGQTPIQDTDTELDTQIKEKDPPLPPEPSKSKTKKTDPFDPATLPLPESIPRQSWMDWCQHRISIHKPMSALAAKKTINQLEKAFANGYLPQALIDTAVATGSWQGCVFDKHLEPKPTNGATSHAYKTNTPKPGTYAYREQVIKPIIEARRARDRAAREAQELSSSPAEPEGWIEGDFNVCPD